MHHLFIPLCIYVHHLFIPMCIYVHHLFIPMCIIRDQCSALLVFPFWPSQPWFPTLLQLMSHRPVRLPNQCQLFLPWDRNHRHPHPKLKLCSVVLCGTGCTLKDTQYTVETDPVKKQSHGRNIRTFVRTIDTPFKESSSEDLLPAAMCNCILVVFLSMLVCNFSKVSLYIYIHLLYVFVVGSPFKGPLARQGILFQRTLVLCARA